MSDTGAGARDGAMGAGARLEERGVQEQKARAVVEWKTLLDNAARLKAGWGQLPARAIGFRLQELGCRGRLLMRDHEQHLDESQRGLLDTLLFGVLSDIQEQSMTAPVPALHGDWSPPDLELLRDIAAWEYADSSVCSPGHPPWQAVAPLLKRVRAMEVWALDEILRWTQICGAKEPAASDLKRAGVLGCPNLSSDACAELLRLLANSAGLCANGAQCCRCGMELSGLREKALSAVASPWPGPSPLQRLQERVAAFEAWALAEIARWAQLCIATDDSAAGDFTRAAVAGCLGLLSDNARANLPQLLAVIPDLFANGATFRWLRRQWQEGKAKDEGKVADAIGADAEEEAAEPGHVPHQVVIAARAFTAGKRILLVGGTPYEARRHDIEVALQAGSVDWVSRERNEGTGRLAAAAQRVVAGKYDVVVSFLGFLSHSASRMIDDACNGRPVVAARVGRGTGTVAVANAILNGAPPRAA